MAAMTNAERQRRFRERRRDRLNPPLDVRTVDMFVDSVTPVTPSDQAGRLFKVTATDGQNRPCSYFVRGCPICGKPPSVWFTFNGLEFQCKPCQLRVSTVGHVSPGDSVDRWNDRKRDGGRS